VSSASPTAAEARTAFWSELRRDARIVVMVLAVLWAILIINAVAFGGELVKLGIFPRQTVGLRGIVFAPLLHGGVAHLLGNSIGLALLGGLVLLREERDFWIVTLVGALVGGLGTWLFGRATYHVGASGVLFAYLGYLLSTGIFERRAGAILLSLVAGLTWGGLVFGVLPGQPGISWESHLFGFGGGAVAAWFIARRRRARGPAGQG
jgi:membrane associated rhomboid family serine protease